MSKKKDSQLPSFSRFIPLLFFAFVLSALLWRLFQLSSVPLHDWDESIYARIAWEVSQNKSLVMTYNDQVWLEKPPLVIYLLALVISLGGQSELILRGVSLLFGIPLLIALYLLAKKLIGTISKYKVDSIQREVISLLPVAGLLSSPLFVDRMTLVNYDIPLALGWVLFFLADNFKLRLLALFIGVTSKSLLGFFPLFFDIFKPDFFKRIFTWKTIRIYAVFILIPLVWHIFSYFIYGNEFIQQHLIDHLVKRVTTPIELHFGGRMFYFKQIFLEFKYFAAILAIGYAVWIFDALTTLIRTKTLPDYLFLVFGIPLVYISFLTLSSTKIWWYLLAVLPLVSLIVSYLSVRIPVRPVRYALAFLVFVFFLYRFLPQTFLFTPGENGIYTPPDKTQLALCTSKQPGKTVAFMVDDGERKVRNILEAGNIQIGSSFIYGGSPAYVYHSKKAIIFFYDEKKFTAQRNQSDYSVIHKDDKERLKAQGKVLCESGNWSLISNK